MERYSDRAIEILNELHTERLDYESEYLPLIDCANRCKAYEDTGLSPEEIAAAADRRHNCKIDCLLKKYNELSEEAAAMREHLIEKSMLIRQQAREMDRRDKVIRQLEKDLDRATAERDAAIADLEDEDSCRVCKYAIDEVACLCQECVNNKEDTDCEKCPWYGDPCGQCSSGNRNWQWRGLKEDGGNDD